MNILDNMFSPALSTYQTALGRTSKRQALLMNNLANVNVPGYKRQDIDFHVLLNDGMGNASEKQQLLDRAAQRQSESTENRLDGNNVDLEKEVMSITETEMHYQAVADLTAGYFAGLKSAIKEGK